MQELPASMQSMLDQDIQVSFKIPIPTPQGVGFLGAKGKCIAIDIFAITLMTEEGRRILRHEEIQGYTVIGSVTAPQGLVLPSFR